MEQNSIKAAQQSLRYYSSPKSFAVVAGSIIFAQDGRVQRRQFTVKAKSHTPQRSALLLCQRVASNIAAGRRPPRSFILQQLASFFAKQKCSCRENKGRTCPEVVPSARVHHFLCQAWSSDAAGKREPRNSTLQQLAPFWFQQMQQMR